MAGTDPRLKQLLAAVMAIVIAGLWGCNRAQAPIEASKDKPAAVVLISDHPAEFEPKIVTIKVGDTVEWRNTGGIAHSVEFLSGQGPETVVLSASHLMIPNGSYLRRFTASGTYIYGCRFHIISGMAGEIIVK
jgi:plastocyanin